MAIGVSWDGPVAAASGKCAERGGFGSRLYLEYLEQGE
jgi:hypothetical protein